MVKIGTAVVGALVAAALTTTPAFGAPAHPLKAFPTRIVSLSPSATEDLFAVGAGKQVVAVDSFSRYPKNAPTTKLSAYTPNVEAIQKYRPDLVVISDDRNHIVAQLGKLHIRVLEAPVAANLAQVYAQMRQIGAATGHARGAAATVARMQRQIKAIVA